jgi:hypothetical protein
LLHAGKGLLQDAAAEPVPRCAPAQPQYLAASGKLLGRNVKSVAHSPQPDLFSSAVNSRKSMIAKGFLISHLESELPMISDRELLTLL